MLAPKLPPTVNDLLTMKNHELLRHVIHDLRLLPSHLPDGKEIRFDLFHFFYNQDDTCYVCAAGVVALNTFNISTRSEFDEVYKLAPFYVLLGRISDWALGDFYSLNQLFTPEQHTALSRLNSRHGGNPDRHASPERTIAYLGDLVDLLEKWDI